MAASHSDPENEIKFWLKNVFKDEDLKINVLGNSEKGDGYMGDIVFVSVEGNANGKLTKYELVLKCSKKSKALRDSTPVQEIFLHEIFMYQTILQKFADFQKEKGITAPFDNAPKCYGVFTGENMEVIVLENLKSSGYELWPKTQPVSRKHIDMVVTQYAKFHATSLALENERPTEFKELVDTMLHRFNKRHDMTDIIKKLYTRPIDESYELLKNDLDDNILQKWKGLKDKINFFFDDQPQNFPGVKMILHGDCWNNNFMYLHQKGEEKIPLKVAFLDWQVPRYSSPIMDIAYFLFTCISKEDLEELDDILISYHKTFISHLRQLGTKDPTVLYPLRQLLNDWKTYCAFGIFSAALVMKVLYAEKDEVVDIADVANDGKDFTAAFQNDIRDTESYKRRLRPIVEYVVKHDLV